MFSQRKACIAGAIYLLAGFTAFAGTPVTVQLDWITNVQFAGVLVAQEKGWYKEASLDVSIKPIDLATMTTSVASVLKGTNMIGIADGLVLLNARADHKPVKAFATMLQASPLCILFLRDGRILADGPRQELLTAANLSELFQTPVHLAEHEGLFHAW